MKTKWSEKSEDSEVRIALQECQWLEKAESMSINNDVSTQKVWFWSHALLSI